MHLNTHSPPSFPSPFWESHHRRHGPWHPAKLVCRGWAAVSEDGEGRRPPAGAGLPSGL